MGESRTLHDAFLDELRDAYDAEKQLSRTSRSARPCSAACAHVRMTQAACPCDAKPVSTCFTDRCMTTSPVTRKHEVFSRELRRLHAESPDWLRCRTGNGGQRRCDCLLPAAQDPRSPCKYESQWAGPWFEGR